MAVRRRLYKKERAPARDKGVFKNDVKTVVKNGLCNTAPLACPDANHGEVVKAIYSLAYMGGVEVGRGVGYDPLKDEYTAIGKSRTTGKAQDFTIKGEVVAEVIRVARMLNGGKMEKKALA